MFLSSRLLNKFSFNKKGGSYESIKTKVIKEEALMKKIFSKPLKICIV